MKKMFLYLLIIVSIECFAQKQLTEQFVVANDSINYIRIDYSTNGLGAASIVMYEKSEENKAIPIKGAKCLKRIRNLYHTLYYFVEVPKHYTQSMREKVFAEFIEHIKLKDSLIHASLYLVFDKDYSQYYQKTHPNDEKGLAIQRIVIDLTPSTICRALP